MKSYQEMVNSVKFYRTVTVVLVGLIVFILLQFNDTPSKKEYDAMTNIVIDVVKKHNVVNHKLIKAKHRIDELESANEALIKVCNPAVFREAAKKTPLPKMKEA